MRSDETLWDVAFGLYGTMNFPEVGYWSLWNYIRPKADNQNLEIRIIIELAEESWSAYAK